MHDKVPQKSKKNCELHGNDMIIGTTNGINFATVGLIEFGTTGLFPSFKNDLTFRSQVSMDPKKGQTVKHSSIAFFSRGFPNSSDFKIPSF
jgi:hypothetical protein